MNSFKKAFLALFLLASLSVARASDVTVFAAASLTDALKKIAIDYEKSSGDKIAFNFSASNILVTQIKAGAPADIFFSADEAKMDDLAKANLIDKDTRKDLLSNSLVIVVPPYDTNQKLTSATQLADARFKKIALGQPNSVPAGIYAKQYLEKIGIWDKISSRIVPCESVRAALAAVETGNVEAGIVYKTDALHSKTVVVDYEVPIADGPAIAYPVALIHETKNAVAAKKFLEYISSPAAVKIFEQNGFIVKK